MYQNLVNNYIKKYKCKKFLVDTSFIENKMGIDNISYNKYYIIFCIYSILLKINEVSTKNFLYLYFLYNY